ncbi:galactoside alpha-(1,2)-fucosyltransferase 2-like [Liolophura sinensis]|uniref:galactoside alpha-(1,2)-fucosyltransferase 2-like n=1 Tax=Liolophura sinensis TaxID=3198878 RepID=UPI0031588BFB
MFGYAATLGISRRLGMTLVLPSHSKLFDIFEVHADTIVNVTEAKHGIRYERFASAYDPKLLEIPCEKDIFVCCYLQSWKYFTGYENEIRIQFRFRPSIVSKAQSVWDSVIFPATKWNSSTLLKDQGSMRVGEPRGAERPVFVAVHVRRGDKAHHKQTIKMGHRVASEEYLQNGYRFFLNRYNNNVIFVVSSDDQAWVKKVVPSGISVFVSSNRPEVDMAVLSRCNHTLMTVGTYSWWVAWLVNGTTVYYKHLFQPGSYIAKHHNNTLADWGPSSVDRHGVT